MLSDSMCSTADTPLDNHPWKVEKASASGVREWLNANEEMHITTTLNSENCCVHSIHVQFLFLNTLGPVPGKIKPNFKQGFFI